MVTTAGGTSNRAIGSRLAAVAVALWWSVLFFGIIDLTVGIIPAEYPDFENFVAVETSWGLLYTVLVPVPLVAWAIRRWPWPAPQVLAIAAAVLLAGIAAGSGGQVFVAFLVAGSAAFPPMWRPPLRWQVRPAIASARLWPIAALVVLGFVGGLAHAWDALDTARNGLLEDDDTWGLMHLPMHAGFALAVPAAAAVAALALANRAAGWWFAFLPPALSAMWFGIVSMRWEDLVGSVGGGWGAATVVWGVVLLAAGWATGWSTGRATAQSQRRTRRA